MKKLIILCALMSSTLLMAEGISLTAGEPFPDSVKSQNIISRDSLEFNGENSVITLPQTWLPGGFTFMTWIKIDNPIAKIYPLISHIGYNNMLSIGESTPQFILYLDDASVSRLNSSSINVGQWNNIAGVYDPASGEQILYLNGQVASARKLPRKIMINKNLIHVGVDRIPGVKKPNFTEGKFNYIHIIPRPLSAEEINQLYTAEKAVLK